MTSTDTVVKEIPVSDILKDNLVIITGVGKKGEWKRVSIVGDYKTSKQRNRAFDFDFVALLEEIGVKVITTGGAKHTASKSETETAATV